MYAASALRQYQQVNVQAQLADATPHRLIQMLYEGALARMAQAMGAMERGQLSEKGVLIGKAIGIVTGLSQALNRDVGGDYALQLEGLYSYMNRQLMQANLQNDPQLIREVAELMRVIKNGWDAIAPGAAEVR